MNVKSCHSGANADTEIDRAAIHAFRTRFFVPTGERAARVLQTVTEHRPVVEIRGGDGVSGLRRAA